MTLLTQILCLSLVGITVTESWMKHSPAAAPNSTLDYLERTLHGLDRAFDFFSREYKNVNLDAVIGTRIVQASLTVLLQRLQASGLDLKVPPYLLSQISNIRGVAGRVSDLSIPYIMQNEPDYYANIGFVLAEGLFELDYDSRDISKTVPIWPHSAEEAMIEKDSDNCINELTGSKNGVSCAISGTCWQRMTALGYNRYSLSHEVFYLEIAERLGCQLDMSWHIKANNQGSLRLLHDTFCANMLVEAHAIAEGGFKPKSRDLFMEQAALCGMLGYRDFFTSHWLDSILSWQDSKDGCYKWEGWTPDKHQDSERGNRRNKREEKRVTSGCLCHRTTVAVSALAQYVRFIMEVYFAEQD